MLKFVSSAVLAASAFGVALHDGGLGSGELIEDISNIDERVERIHKTLDVDDDDVVDVVEFAEFVYIAEEGGYISHYEAQLFAYFILKLHHEKGAEVSLQEAYDAVADVVDDATFGIVAVNMILECLDLIEWVVFMHGTVKTFFEADTNDDYQLSRAELADAGMARFLKEFDEDNDKHLSNSEYANAVAS